MGKRFNFGAKKNFFAKFYLLSSKPGKASTPFKAQHSMIFMGALALVTKKTNQFFAFHFFLNSTIFKSSFKGSINHQFWSHSKRMSLTEWTLSSTSTPCHTLSFFLDLSPLCHLPQNKKIKKNGEERFLKK